MFFVAMVICLKKDEDEGDEDKGREAEAEAEEDDDEDDDEDEENNQSRRHKWDFILNGDTNISAFQPSRSIGRKDA